LPGAGSAPREGLFVPNARELNIHPVRHDRPKLQPSRHVAVILALCRRSIQQRSRSAACPRHSVDAGGTGRPPEPPGGDSDPLSCSEVRMGVP
jgi:hypothetical protein